MRYFPQTDETMATMLSAVRKNSVDELFSSIPESLRLKRPLALPKKLDELGIKRELHQFYLPSKYVSFLGAGATEHFVPEWVSQQLLRAEWYTSYTPYQPEASQGTLQAIFEFQSMVASLFGLEIANASMYDGATALVEALLMAVRVTSKKTVVISSAIHPEYRQCIYTYLSSAGYRVVEIGFEESGLTDTGALVHALSTAPDLAAIAMQSPNFFGRLEDTKEMARLAHRHQALAIAATTDMSSTAIVSPHGANGIDIAVGDGLGLLSGLSLGGPGVGLLASTKQLLRQLPGRLVGLTTDHEGRPGYVLTLSTREQHIRREKATSNICTNHNLMALAFSMTLSAYGKQGFLNLAKANLKKTLYFRRCLRQLGCAPVFNGPHYNETVLDIGQPLKKRLKIAEKQNILAGLPLESFYPQLPGHLLVCTTELHRDQDIQRLSEILCGAYDEKT